MNTTPNRQCSLEEQTILARFATRTRRAARHCVEVLGQHGVFAVF